MTFSGYESSCDSHGTDAYYTLKRGMSLPLLIKAEYEDNKYIKRCNIRMQDDRDGPDELQHAPSLKPAGLKRTMTGMKGGDNALLAQMNRVCHYHQLV